MLSVLATPLVSPAANVLPTRRSCLPLPLVPVPVPSPRSRTKSLPLLFAALHTPVLVPAVLPASARLSGPASRSPSTATSPEIQTPTAPCIPAIVLAILFATPLRSASHPLLPTPHTPPAASVLLLPAPPPPLPALLPAPAALLRSLLARSGILLSSPAHRSVLKTPTPHPFSIVLNPPSGTSALHSLCCTGSPRTSLPSFPAGSNILAPVLLLRCTTLPLLPPAPDANLDPTHTSACSRSVARSVHSLLDQLHSASPGQQLRSSLPSDHTDW